MRDNLKVTFKRESCIPGRPNQDTEDTAGCPDVQLPSAPALHSGQQQMVRSKGNRITVEGMGEALTVWGSTV